MNTTQQTMTSPTISSAVTHNNLGAIALNECRYEDAIARFSEALRCAKSLMDQGEDQMMIEEDACLRLDQCMLAGSDFHEDDVDYIYRSPMSIDPEETSGCYDSYLFISAVAIFNLAMAHQLAALDSNNHSSSNSNPTLNLQKAARLYELAISLNQEHNFDSNYYFMLSIVNNLGMVYMRLQKIEAATKCFQSILSTLLVLTVSDGCPNSLRTSFFRNAMKLVGQPINAAAAA